MTNDPRNAIGAVLAETTALNAALSVANGTGDAAEAVRLTQNVLTTRRSLLSDPVEETITAAMRVVAGEKIPPARNIGGSGPIVATCLAWREWVAGSTKDASRRINDVLSVLGKGSADAIEAMTIRFWAEAVGCLAASDREEARRLFRRAHDLATNYGTETSLLIAWTYAASFRP